MYIVVEFCEVYFELFWGPANFSDFLGGYDSIFSLIKLTKMTAIQIITKEEQNNFERHLIIGFDTKVLQSLISSHH